MSSYKHIGPEGKYIIDRIAKNKVKSDEEWLALEAKMIEYLKTASDEEELEFAESGSCTLLFSFCFTLQRGITPAKLPLFSQKLKNQNH